MPRIRQIECTCGFIATDGHFREGCCPRCGEKPTVANSRFVRIGLDGIDPVEWLRTGWMAGNNGESRNGTAES